MMLAQSETRLLFYPEGLTATAWAVAVVGAAVFGGLVAHWVVRAKAWGLAPLLAVPPLAALAAWLRGRGAGAAAGTEGGGAGPVEPVLPWWQILVGFALAGMLVPAALAASRDPKP
ncbi:MAG: hypothetical protein FJ313_06485, partial [Gemmatimonadetes bacterium]|nr:hypothetical protein [Gemmatimonadota bacterium]